MKQYLINGRVQKAFKFDGTINQLETELPKAVFDRLQSEAYDQVDDDLCEQRKVVYDADHKIQVIYPARFYMAEDFLWWPHDRIKQAHHRGNGHGYQHWIKHYLASWKVDRKANGTKRVLCNAFYNPRGVNYNYLEAYQGLHFGDYVSISYKTVYVRDGFNTANNLWVLKPIVHLYKPAMVQPLND